MGRHPGWVKRGLAVIYKSVADRLRIRVNGADCRVGDVLPSEKKPWRVSSGYRG